MASRYWIGNNSVWNSTANWSTISGGSGGASVPTASDNVFLDSNSPGNCVINPNTTQQCLDLDCDGFAYQLTLGADVSGNPTGGNLRVNGNCTLVSTMTVLSFIVNQPSIKTHAGILSIYGEFNASGTQIDVLRLRLFGTLGTVQNITGNNIDSIGGKRIYAAGSTLSNCPFWRDYAEPSASTVHITNATELQDIADTNDGIYVLDNDIDLTGVSWTPLGEGNIYENQYFGDAFTGSFDGQGLTISNLTLDNSEARDGTGIFAKIGSSSSTTEECYHRGIISNLNLSTFNLTADDNIGGLVGVSLGCVINSCSVSGITIIEGTDDLDFVGGLIGFAIGRTTLISSLTNCSVNGMTINNTTGSSTSIGGLVGDCEAGNFGEFTIDGCYTTNLNINGYLFQVGGLLGFVFGIDIDDCYSTEVNFSGYLNGVGGLFGDFRTSDLSKCYSSIEFDLDIDDFCDSVGGLIGSNLSSTIVNCYSEGTIDATTEGHSQIGGFCGFNGDDITNSYSNVAITLAGTSSDMIGGFIGGANGFVLINCFSVGIVTATGTSIGGFIGRIFGGETITNCAWYTSAEDNAVGLYSGSPVETLAENNWGTDESDNTTFQNTTNHVVFAQGT
jgi:hypothetical protein